MEIVAVPFDDPRLEELLAERRRDLKARYAGVEDHPSDPTDPLDFRPPRGASLMAVRDGIPAACGALRPLEPGLAEIKRMYVGERFRRRGLAGAILLALEGAAVGAGYATLRLETGTLQPEAIAFYERWGYARIPCYGRWSGYRLSLCYERDLTAPRAARGR